MLSAWHLYLDTAEITTVLCIIHLSRVGCRLLLVESVHILGHFGRIGHCRLTTILVRSSNSGLLLVRALLCIGALSDLGTAFALTDSTEGAVSVVTALFRTSW